MDEQTEKTLAGLIERIIKRYISLEEKMDSCTADFKALRKDMRDAALLLRDKHDWRLSEVDRELRKLDDRMEPGGE